MGDSMQIESLWRFNAKFDPDWVPRYAVYSAPEQLLTAALAVAEAESFWELPVIGRFLKPKNGRRRPSSAPGAPRTARATPRSRTPPPSPDGSRDDDGPLRVVTRHLSSWPGPGVNGVPGCR